MDLTLKINIPMNITISLEKEISEAELKETISELINLGLQKKKYGNPIVDQVSDDKFNFLLLK